MAILPPTKKPQHQPLIDPTPLRTSKLYDGSNSITSNIFTRNSNSITSNIFTPNNFIEHTIQGECLYAEHRISDLEAQRIGFDRLPQAHEEAIKKELTLKIAEELRKSNRIEFTRSYSPETNDYVFRARVFVVPDNNIKILREAKIVK